MILCLRGGEGLDEPTVARDDLAVLEHELADGPRDDGLCGRACRNDHQIGGGARHKAVALEAERSGSPVACCLERELDVLVAANVLR